MRLAILAVVSLCFAAAIAHAQSPGGRWARVTESKPLPAAMGGCCPVSLRDRQQWQPGDVRASALFDGQRYQFASQRERDIFAAAPEKYVPLLGGDCPVSFAETGERTPGRLEYGVLHGSRLAFFGSEDERHDFLDDPARFNDADLAIGGRCIVARHDLARDVAGIPETVATHQGLRYYFASAHDRALFLRNPGRYDGSSSRESMQPLQKPLAVEAAEEGRVESGPWARINSGAEPSRSLGSNQEDVILGAAPSMAGYCPVTLRRDGAWVRGRYEFRVPLGPLAFLTAGPKERDALTSDPAKYVPALGGDCAVSFVARGERLRGSVYHAYEYEGRLFLFADAERKAVFKASPVTYAAADLAAGGVCVVSQVNEQRENPGTAEHATWHQGKVYRFVGAEEKRKFLAEPEKYAVGQAF